MTTEHLGPEAKLGGRSTDPKTAPLVPVLVELTHRRALYAFDNEETGVRESRPGGAISSTVRCRGWQRSNGRIIEYKGTLGEVTLSESDPTDEDLEWLRNIGALPSAEQDFMLGRTGVQATAIGIARLRLQRGDPVGALRALDDACEELRRRHWDACLADGHDPERIELLLGPKPA